MRPARSLPSRLPTDASRSPDRHIFIVLFLIACVFKLVSIPTFYALISFLPESRSQEGLDFSHFHGANQEGTKVSDSGRDLLNAQGDLTPTELAQVVKDIEFVEQDTVRTCACCERPKREIPALVASGKNFSFCSTWCVSLPMTSPALF